jgi:glycosyltransferase involved in cell wall biosynthesis
MGSLWPANGGQIFPGHIQGHGLPYLNLPKVRNWFLARQYQQALERLLADKQVDLVVSYNAEAYVTAPIAKVLSKSPLPWAAIIADLPKLNPRRFLGHSKVEDANGRIYLSWKNFNEYGDHQKDIYLEGGVHQQIGQTQKEVSEIKRIAYFGGITALGGIDLFLEASNLLPGPGYEFHIVGVGDITRLRDYLKSDSRIVYHGPLSQVELIKLGQQMNIFVNPRPSKLSENNFPSKILTYLGFGKPVISTFGYGISPDYKNILVGIDEETAPALAAAIEEVAQWDQEQLNQYQIKVHTFVRESKAWNIQAKRMLSWFESLVDAKLKQKVGL